MAEKVEESEISGTIKDQHPDAEEKMIPETSGISCEASKTKKNPRKKTAKQSKKSKKSSDEQGKRQTKITKYLAGKKKVVEPQEQPEEVPGTNAEPLADDEDLIKNTGMIKPKQMKNRKKSRQISALESSSSEEEASSENKKSISEFDKIQQQLAKIEMLRAEFSKGPDISEVITDMKKAEDQPQNQSMIRSENGSDSDDVFEIDLKQYFFTKHDYRRIRNSLRDLPKPAAGSECTVNHFLRLLGSGTDKQNDPFNIGKLLFDEKIIDDGKLMSLLNCCFTFNQLIDTFRANAMDDGILKMVGGKEPSPEEEEEEEVDHQHHYWRYINDAQILQKYVNLYAINAKKLMINDPNEMVDCSRESRTMPLFVYCLLAQEICLKTFQYTANKKKKNIKNDDDDRSRFIIDLLNTFPAIPNYACTMMMVLFESVDETKRNECLLKQLSTILIIGLFDGFQYFQQDIDKFFQQLELMVTLQSRMLDCIANHVESIHVSEQNRPSFNDDDDDEDGQDDDPVRDRECDQTMSVYLFLLYVCLTLRTFYHAKDKFCLANNDHENDRGRNHNDINSINSVQRSFMVNDHLKSMLAKLFQWMLNGYNIGNVFGKFYRLVFRWHRLDRTFQAHPNMQSLREDRICIQLIIIIETFSQLMLFLPSWLSKTGEHLHLFWMLFTLIKLKCKPESESGSGSGTESSLQSDQPVARIGGHESICRTFEQAIQPMIDIVWRELPFGCQIYLVHFISAYITNFGTNPFILNLCKTLFNIPGMDFKFRSMISALSMDF